MNREVQSSEIVYHPMSSLFSSVQPLWQQTEKVKPYFQPVGFSQEGFNPHLFCNSLHSDLIAYFLLWEMSRLVSDSPVRHWFQARCSKCQPFDNKWWGAEGVVTQSIIAAPPADGCLAKHVYEIPASPVGVGLAVSELLQQSSHLVPTTKQNSKFLFPAARSRPS